MGSPPKKGGRGGRFVNSLGLVSVHLQNCHYRLALESEKRDLMLLSDLRGLASRMEMHGNALSIDSDSNRNHF